MLRKMFIASDVEEWYPINAPAAKAKKYKYLVSFCLSTKRRPKRVEKKVTHTKNNGRIDSNKTFTSQNLPFCRSALKWQ